MAAAVKKEGSAATPLSRAWEITTPDGADRRYREGIMAGIPHDIASSLIDAYLGTAANAGRIAANIDLRESVESVVQSVDWALLSSSSALKRSAERSALACASIASSAADEATAMAGCRAFALTLGVIPPPQKTGESAKPCLLRLQCLRWWRRQLRRQVNRRAESACIKLGMVHRRAGRYISSRALKHRREHLSESDKIMMRTILRRGDGQEISLYDAAQCTVSNPVVRRAELLTRVAGFEAIAKGRGDECLFVTWTAPSKYHSRAYNDGSILPNWGGQSPADAQQHLCKQWQSARAMLHKAGLHIYGMRVAEPHHDGCTHWHMLIFCASTSAARVGKVLRECALRVDGDEKGAEKNRCKIVKIDPARGTASGYVSKYISKNVGGEKDEEGKKKENKGGQERVEAWRSLWGVRQFQFFGGPPVGIWREFRRLNSALVDPAAEALRYEISVKISWEGYCRAVGPLAGANAMSVKLLRAHVDKLTAYGEDSPARVIGVSVGSCDIITRLWDWQIVKPGKSEGEPAEITPWTSVNNCNGTVPQGRIKGGMWCESTKKIFEKCRSALLEEQQHQTKEVN